MLSYLLSCSHLVKKYSKECFRVFCSDSSFVLIPQITKSLAHPFLVLKYAEAVVMRCSVKKMFLKFCKIHRKKPFLEYLFNKAAALRRATSL